MLAHDIGVNLVAELRNARTRRLTHSVVVRLTLLNVKVNLQHKPATVNVSECIGVMLTHTDTDTHTLTHTHSHARTLTYTRTHTLSSSSLTVSSMYVSTSDRPCSPASSRHDSCEYSFTPSAT